MAYTANTGFRYYASTTGSQPAPVPTVIRLANSQTLRVGDLVRINTSGFVVPAASGEAVGGVCVGIVDESGINPFSLGYNTGNPSVTLTGDDTVTTSSSNQTSAHYIQAEVILDFAGTNLWLNKADSALAQSNLLALFNVATSRQVTVGSASNTTGQVQLVRLDPDATGGSPADSTKGLFRICLNQYGNLIDVATAKRAA